MLLLDLFEDLFRFQARTCDLVLRIEMHQDIFNLYVGKGHLLLDIFRVVKPPDIDIRTYLITPFENTIGPIFRFMIYIDELRYASFLNVFCVFPCLIPVKGSSLRQ